MPTYRVTDSVTGKTLKLTGDSPPTEQELVGIFEQFRPKAEPSFMDKAKKVVSDIGQGMTGMAKEGATGGQAVGEAVLALGTGLGAMGLGVTGQIMTHVKERPWAAETTKKAKQVRKGAEELFSYQPKSEGGKQLTETLGSIIGLPAILGNILERDPETAAKFAEGIPNQTIKDVAQFTAMSLQELGEPVRYSMDQLGIGGGTIEDLSKLMLEFYGYGKLNQGVKSTGAAIKKGRGVVSDANATIGGMVDLLEPQKQPPVPLERSPMPTPAARSPYSPELASQLSDKPLALPEGQGFEILPDGTQRPILRTREFEETPPIIGETPTATDIVPLRTNVALDEQAFLRDAQDRVLLDKVNEMSGNVDTLPKRESATGLVKPVEEYMGKRGDLNAVKEGEIPEGGVVQRQGASQVGETAKTGSGDSAQKGGKVQEEVMGQVGTQTTGRKSYPRKEVQEHTNTIKNKFIKWVTGEQDVVPTPDKLYRGFRTDEPTTSKYAHASPWLRVADKSGMIDGEGHLVESYTPAPDQLYYRGGSLAGDPLESTRIGSVEGMTWGEALNKSKELYKTQVAKKEKATKSLYKQQGMEYGEKDAAAVRKNVAEDVFGDFFNAVYETDVGNLPGKWRGRTDIPKDFSSNRPKLRTKKQVEKHEKLWEESQKASKEVVNDDIQVLTERGADPEVLNGMTPEAVSNMRWMSDQMEAKRIIRDIELGTKVTPEERAIAAKVVGEKAIRKLGKENKKALDNALPMDAEGNVIFPKEEKVSKTEPLGEEYIYRPAKTAPQAEAGKYSDPDKIIARPIDQVGIKYGDELPSNVYLHGSKNTKGDIENFSVSTRPSGATYLTKDWEIADGYANGVESNIKAIEINPDATIYDLSKAKDRRRVAEIILEEQEVDLGIDVKNFADELVDSDFHARGLSDNTEIGNALYDANVDALIDARGNVDVINDNAIKTYNPLPNPSRPPEVGEQSGTVNLGQKGASKTKAKEPDSIRIEKTEKPEVKAETPKGEKPVTAHGTENPNLRVAVKDENGKVYVGEKGEIHAEVAEKNGLLEKPTEVETGFVDKDGKFINKSTPEKQVKPADLNLKDRDLTDPKVQNEAMNEIHEVFKNDEAGHKNAVHEFVRELKRQTEPKKTEPVKTEPVKTEQVANPKLESINKQIAEIEAQNRDAIKNRQEVPEARLNRLYKLKQDKDIAEKSLSGAERKPAITAEKAEPVEGITTLEEVKKGGIIQRKNMKVEITPSGDKVSVKIIRKGEPVVSQTGTPEAIQKIINSYENASKPKKLTPATADTIEQALNKKLDFINKKIEDLEAQNKKAIEKGQDVPEDRLSKLEQFKLDRDQVEEALYKIERKPEKTAKAKDTAEARTIEASLEDKKAAMELGIPTEEYMAGKKANKDKGEVTLYSNPIAPVFQEIKNRFVKFTDNLEFRSMAKTSDETFAHFVKRILQDRRIAIKTWEAELKERGINIPDRLSVHMTFERMPSKVADTMLQFERDVKKPLIKSITNLWKESKLTFDNLTEYMQAIDAAPRYKAIQNRLKKMKEEAASPEEIAELEKRGSGMSQEEANAILEKYRKTGADKKMDDVAKMIHNIAEARLDLLEKYGLETPEMIKQMREEFGPTYVPWRGKEGVKKYGRTGASYSGSTIKHALGRTSKATENPIAHILNDYQNTVIKIFENEPKRTMLELVREIKDPDITVNEVTLKQRLNKEGQVETYRDAVWSANDTLNPGLDNVIDVMDNGKHYYIKIKGDPLLVRAFQKLPVGSLEALTGGIGKWTRAMAQLKTMYSPEFILTNPFRDMFDAVHGLATEHKASYVADAMKDYKTSMKECYDYFRNGKANDLTEIKNMDGSVSKVNLTKEYMENVQVGFWSAKDISIAERDLGKQLQREVASGIKGGTARTWKAVSDYVSDMSSVTENAMRMSVYRTLRKNGHSMEQAAAYAKNVTLNFNRRGELGWISNLYMFANPGIQGIKRFKDLATTKRGMKILTGITTAAVTLNIMNRWLAGEDDSGTNNFAKMSAGERSRNLIFMGTDGRPLIKLPLGFQQRLPFGIANSIADVIMGDVHPVKASLDFADVFFDSFNPISGSSITKGTAASFAPSLAKPFFEIESNTDTFGRPIYPKAMIGEDKPESELFFRSVSPISKEIAQGLHRLSGKDKFHAGGIDVSPESIDHVVKNYFGGIGDTLYRAASLAFKTADDMTPISTIGRHEIPLARRFTGANIDQFSQNRFREIIDELRPDKKSIDNANDILKNGDPLSSEYDNAVKTLQEYDDKTELIEKYAERVREVSDINKEIDKVKAEKDMPVWYRRETIEYLEGKKIDIYNQTIWQYNNRKMLKGTEPTEDMI